MNILHSQIKNCTGCGLYKLMPDGCKPVPGIGPIDSPIMLVGEALGRDESIMEEPFVGQCGQLLDVILKESGFIREQLYITNTVKCRPTDTGTKSRKPSDNEISSCYDWLLQELKLIKPKFIITLGSVPTERFTHKKIKMKDVVGKIFTYALGNGPPHIDDSILFESQVFPVYHPSFLMVYGKKYLDKTTEIFRKVKELSGI